MLVQSLPYPTKDLCETIRDGDFDKGLHSCLAELDYGLIWKGEFTGSLDDLEVDYTHLFLVEPLCPLREDAHTSGADSWEELVRFYEFFGLNLAAYGDRLPDHLSVQLEFLHFLAFCEVESTGKDCITDYRLAQRDFLARHLCRWVPNATEKLRTSLNRRNWALEGGILFYSCLLDLVRDFVMADFEYLEAVLNPG
jgi:DMSO reductase family type II enzyme chaperone